MLQGEAEAIVRRLVAAAKRGNMRAIEPVLARVLPAPKGRPIALALPGMAACPPWDQPDAPPMPRILERLARYSQPVALMPRDVREFLDREDAKAGAKAAAEDVS
jgi:hypothetical protein